MYRYHAVKRGSRDEKLRSCLRNYHRVLFILKKSKIITVKSLRYIQVPTHVSASTGEIMTSSNLDELQTFLNSKLRHQHQHQPALPAPAAHHHYHPHQSSHLSQQQRFNRRRLTASMYNKIKQLNKTVTPYN